MRRALLVLPLLLAGCGAAQHVAAPAFTVHTYGNGATRSWVYVPAGEPKLIVLFVHGLGGQRETTPYYHRAWLAHMAREGWEVVYPAYEAHPLQNGALKHLVEGVALAGRHVAHSVPVAAIGYSRGGRLVVDFASVSTVTGLVPRRIFSVFPAGTMDTPLDLAPLDGRTRVLIVAGDRDNTVANVGANQLVTQLAIAGFPYGDVTFEVVRSHGFFVADHLSVLEDSAGARRAFWARADRFFSPLVRDR
jgi:predicted alpha/beta-hydrolase family hydrolase